MTVIARGDPHPVAQRVFELLRESGIVEGKGWALQEEYGYRKGVDPDVAPTEIILFYGGGDTFLLSVDTESEGFSSSLAAFVEELADHLESSDQFRRSEEDDVESDPWEIPSLAHRENAWGLETRAWGQDLRFEILDPELLPEE